jgi:hypothetical protein
MLVTLNAIFVASSRWSRRRRCICICASDGPFRCSVLPRLQCDRHRQRSSRRVFEEGKRYCFWCQPVHCHFRRRGCCHPRSLRLSSHVHVANRLISMDPIALVRSDVIGRTTQPDAYATSYFDPCPLIHSQPSSAKLHMRASRNYLLNGTQPDTLGCGPSSLVIASPCCSPRSAVAPRTNGAFRSIISF